MPGTAHTDIPRDAGTANRSGANAWSWDLLGILLLTAAIRAVVVSQTPIIAKDGMLYVGIARMINHGMWLDLVGDWFLFNPYPALIAWLQRCGLSFDFSGQLISAVASTLAVVPLYLWGRRAFDPRVAQLAALTYALHPVMLRFSGQVLREGLYWCLMLWAVYAFWLAAQHRQLWRFAVAGLLTTAATLTRMEGAVLFILGAMWSISMCSGPANRHASTVASGAAGGARLLPSWHACRQSLAPIVVACAVFPLTIIILNLAFIPQGHGWHGCGRWIHFATRLVRGQEVAPAATIVPQRMAEIVSSERTRTAQQSPKIDDVRRLAKSLPVWNPLGEPDLEQLRLQRFLILADDQRLFLFAGRFLNECWDGLLFPCVICCFYGLYAGRQTRWVTRRDGPLAIMSVILSGMLIYHLSTEFILEPRYMFCLIPFVFPWSGIGARELHRQVSAWFAGRPAWAAWQPSAPVLCVALMLLALGKLWMGLEDDTKLVQRQLGTRLRHTATGRLKIAGPESLRRVAHYAEADYFIIPRGDADAARRWLDEQHVDFVLTTPEEQRIVQRESPPSANGAMRYRPWESDHVKLGPIHVYWVDPAIRMLGS